MSRPVYNYWKDTLPEPNSQRPPPKKNGWLGPERVHIIHLKTCMIFRGCKLIASGRVYHHPWPSQMWRLQLLSAHVGDAEPKWSEMPSQKLHKFKAWGWQFEPGTGELVIGRRLHFDSKSFLEIGPFFSFSLRIQTPNSKIRGVDGDFIPSPWTGLDLGILPPFLTDP